MNRRIQSTSHLRGEISVPGDKSISHRAIMLGAIADGDTRISNFLDSADCLSTISCFEAMGISFEQDRKQNTVIVHGRGMHGLTAPSDVLDTGNSGTTTRLISGILAGQEFGSLLDGDASIRKRPMKRIMDPLHKMGAKIRSVRGNDCAPLEISPSVLHAVDYVSTVASAQVKSCILLAGLYADGCTTVTETRDAVQPSECLRYYGTRGYLFRGLHDRGSLGCSRKRGSDPECRNQPHTLRDSHCSKADGRTCGNSERKICGYRASR